MQPGRRRSHIRSHFSHITQLTHGRQSHHGRPGGVHQRGHGPRPGKGAGPASGGKGNEGREARRGKRAAALAAAPQPHHFLFLCGRVAEGKRKPGGVSCDARACAQAKRERVPGLEKGREVRCGTARAFSHGSQPLHPQFHPLSLSQLAKARAAAAAANPVPMEAAPTMADDKASAAAAAALRVRGGRAGKKDRRRAGNAAAAGDASLPHPLAPGGIHQFHPMKPKGKKRLRTSIFTRHG